MGDRIGELAIRGNLEGEDFAAAITCEDKAPLSVVEHDLDHALFKIRHSDGVDDFEIAGCFDAEGTEGGKRGLRLMAGEEETASRGFRRRPGNLASWPERARRRSESVPEAAFHLPTWIPSPSPGADDPMYTYSLALGATAPSLVAARVAVAAETNPRRVQDFMTVTMHSQGFETYLFSLVSSCAARRIHERVFGRKIAGDADDQEFQRSATIVGERLSLVEPDRDGVSAMNWSRLRIDGRCAIAGDHIVDLAHV